MGVQALPVIVQHGPFPTQIDPLTVVVLAQALQHLSILKTVCSGVRHQLFYDSLANAEVRHILQTGHMIHASPAAHAYMFERGHLMQV